MDSAEGLRHSFLYRGTLASCNYRCPYCPFAKRRDSRATLARDARELARFVDWIAARGDVQPPPPPADILFTPWGEALTRRPYQAALIRLSHLPGVARVAIQTNLSRAPRWLGAAQADKISLWCTYHPGETALPGFLQRLAVADAQGARYSVGMVALPEHFAAIAALRQALPPQIYLWLNPYQRPGSDRPQTEIYRPQDIAWLTGIDPWFGHALRPRPSRNAPCRAGESAWSVTASGHLRPCHFRSEDLGPLPPPGHPMPPDPGPCNQDHCDCYIGYILRRDHPQATHFGLGALGRVPPDFTWIPLGHPPPSPPKKTR